jgi:2-dehydro-3-deoxygluconokinase
VTHVLVVGEPLVELLEESPGVVRAGFGGDALNVAIYLTREAPALRVSLGAAVGDDPPSVDLRRMCRGEGLELSFLRRVPGSAIGRYHVTVDASGERAFRYERRDSPFRGLLDSDDHPLPDPAAVDLLWFSGIGLAVLHEAGRRRLLGYADSVRLAGGVVAYDPNHRPTLWERTGDAREWTARVTRSADIVLASMDDGRSLTDAVTVRDVAVEFRSWGATEVVVTDGSAPCVVAHDGGVAEVPAMERGDVVDTTAAGDAFDAGYIAARLRGNDPERCARAGHRLAATVVGYRGALGPRRD